jgi:hypothetical protein
MAGGTICRYRGRECIGVALFTVQLHMGTGKSKLCQRVVERSRDPGVGGVTLVTCRTGEQAGMDRRFRMAGGTGGREGGKGRIGVTFFTL